MTTAEQNLLDRIRRIDVCSLSDAMDALNLSGVLEGLLPVWEGARFAGRALTVRLAEGAPPEGAPPVHLGARAIDAATPGDVIVIDNGGRTAMGSWGGLLSSAAQMAGVAGVVTDGACRDVDEARELAFPVVARRPAIRTARGRVHEAAFNEPISIGTVTVAPGDVVAADGSGVVVIAARDVESVLTRAEAICAREGGMLADLRLGKQVSEVMGSSYEHLLSEK